MTLTDKAASFARTETEEGKPMSDVPEMVEKVARAICLSGGTNPDAILLVPGPDIPYWRRYEPHARAAIAAMREPVEAMVEAAWPNIMHENARDVWQDMVDAALGNSEVAR